MLYWKQEKEGMDMAGHILLAEDDRALSALMQDFFRAAGVARHPGV